MSTSMNKHALDLVNLRKLRNELARVATQKTFDMSAWRRDQFGDICSFRSKEDCGTSGCAMGHSPFIPGLGPRRSDCCGVGGGLSWSCYSDRVFGCSKGPAWDFVFSAKWKDADNTLEGAIARMDVVLTGSFDMSVLPGTEQES